MRLTRPSVVHKERREDYGTYFKCKSIPYIFEAYTYKNVYGMDELAKNMYAKVDGGEKHGCTPEACVNCGKCKTKCPQNIDIPAMLKKVAAELGM